MNAKDLKLRVEAAIIPENPLTPLDEFQCAKLLNVSVYWLRTSRSKGQGPEVTRIGGQIRYTQDAVKKFVHRISSKQRHTKNNQQSN